tara:strand:- start:4508 stop:4744 length:237 start_codon:yes stop_codon:yes gene_type:complete
MIIKDKLKAQVKTKFYYLFWGLATVSVFAGQLYVGSGYRKMAETSEQISADVSLLIETMIYGRGRPQSSPSPDYPIIR